HRTATPGTSPLSLHDALPIYQRGGLGSALVAGPLRRDPAHGGLGAGGAVAEFARRGHREQSAAGDHPDPVRQLLGLLQVVGREQDRKSTRLNSSHGSISYAVF